MLLQALSLEVWGRPHTLNGSFPYVKAYVGPLPVADFGFEFETDIPPDDLLPCAKWYPPSSAWLVPAVADTAAIRVRITRVRYGNGTLVAPVDWQP